jgi:hypothetical protein
MLLNSQIWNETINAAKAAASTSPAWLRAIERAVVEIERSRYWSFDGDVLTIISTTSKKTYKIGLSQSRAMASATRRRTRRAQR